MDCAARAVVVCSQSLLLRGERFRLDGTSIACRVSRHVDSPPLVTFTKDTSRGESFQRRSWIDEGRPCTHRIAAYEKNFTHHCFSCKASEKGHVLCCKEREEGWNVFRITPRLCTLFHIDAVQAARWARATAFFLFVSFVLGIRAASASQVQSTRAPPIADSTTVSKSSGAKGAVKEQQEIFVKGNVLEKALQDLSSAPEKLVVPLRVASLRGSVPPIWLKDFMLSQGKRVKIKFESQGGLKEIMSALDSALKKKQITPRSILAADVVTLGDSWLQAAVSGDLIRPIENAEQYEWFNRLGPKWQAFLRRDKDGHLHPKGLIWGAPYRWGSMVIAFRTDKLSRNNIPGIEDWKDLWRPELSGKIAMVDSSREVVGAVLKSLGASYNTQDFDTDVEGGRSAVKRQFYALQKQVKVFDSVHYLKALQSDDVWVAVGWSNDVIPVAKRMSNVRVIAPKSGASLWADLWAIPATGSVPSNKIGSRVSGASPLVNQWLDFCLQPARAEPFKQGTFVGASPLQVFEEDSKVIAYGKQGSIDDTSGQEMEGVHSAADSRSSGPAMDTNMIDGLPPVDSLEKSEMLEPLSEKALADYRWLVSQAETQVSFSKKVLEVINQLF